MDMGTWSSGGYLLSVDVEMTLDSLNWNALQVDCGPSRGRKQDSWPAADPGKLAGGPHWMPQIFQIFETGRIL